MGGQASTKLPSKPLPKRTQCPWWGGRRETGSSRTLPTASVMHGLWRGPLKQRIKPREPRFRPHLNHLPRLAWL